MSKKLIAFYSRADENYVSGEIKNLKVGNTQTAAEMIENHTNADIFKIEQIKPYSKGYNDCIDEAKKDQQSNARPELKEYLPSISEYDEIYLGYPNFWGTMPMAVFTFLEHYDFSGKIIKPFCTHEGSAMGSSVSDIEKLCPNSTVKKGLAIHGSRVDKSEKEIIKWIEE